MLCELVYVHGSHIATGGVQLSDVTKPLRTRIRHAYFGAAGYSRSDMGGAFYRKPRSTTESLLAVAASEQWPELLDDAAEGQRPEPRHNEACALVPAALVRPEGTPAVLMELPPALQDGYFGLQQRRSAAGGVSTPVCTCHHRRWHLQRPTPRHSCCITGHNSV